MKKYVYVLIIIALLVCPAGINIQADETGAEKVSTDVNSQIKDTLTEETKVESDDEWEVHLIPYLWAASMKVDSSRW